MSQACYICYQHKLHEYNKRTKAKCHQAQNNTAQINDYTTNEA